MTQIERERERETETERDRERERQGERERERQRETGREREREIFTIEKVIYIMLTLLDFSIMIIQIHEHPSCMIVSLKR